MKKQTLFKKLLSSVMVAIIVLGQFSGLKFKSQAAAITGEDGPIYISLSKTNDNGNGYAFDMNANGGLGKNIWSMVFSADENANSIEYASNLYCIKAEYGETWKNDASTKVKYNKNYPVPLTTNTEQILANNVLLGEHKNEILWLIDNLYIKGESNQRDFIKYLQDAGIIYEEGYGYSYLPSEKHDYTGLVSTNTFAETVNEEDIIAIQQAAIWYYTNYGENENIYNKLGKANWLQYTNESLLADTTGKNKYPELSSISKARGEHAIIIYNYLINEAKRVAESLGSNEYKLKNSTAKVWISLANDGSANSEQPVIEVHKLPEKPFDLVLRKAIVSVNGSRETKNVLGESATRPLKIDDNSIQNIDTSILENNTTADYKHRKDPVVVKTGDIVTYSITIYNEGEEAGYATKIVDQLPGTASTLRLDNKNSNIITSSNGNIYKVEYSPLTNRITLKMTAESPKNELAAYDREKNIIEYETILLDCVVEGKADTDNQKILTNIAYISEEYNADRDVTITANTIQDRDSQTWNSPKYSAGNLVTTDIGYTGNNSNGTNLSNNDIHYKGQQDDDDFEKLVILPESFDLSLRKYITKVDGKEIENSREPEEVITNLDNGSNTTAEYNHRKDAVKVEDGSKVEYKISLYNEGSIDGVATIVKDQLPTGLKLNKEYFTKEGDKYFTTSSKGNVYEVQYDETSNIVIFTLDKTKTQTVTLLQSHKNGQKLDEDILTLECRVECKADDNENTYLTNIAYIYQAEQEDGTIVEKQQTGPDADRDSQPHTYPNKNKDELKTTGDIGYKGNDKNPSDLTQSNTHYAGQQDDDDFEKLVILPESFDLSLRKYITKVDGKEIENSREPEEVITNLDNGSNTTAEYNHRKDAVKVEDGSKVEYKISLYNEGSIDGVATIVKDQLPTGLKLNKEYFTKEGDKYFTTSSKGNVYEVQYDETSNIVIFTLDKTKTQTVTLLQSHKNGQKLDEDILTLECRVECKADDNENTYLTNIAYIYQAEQEDGTIVEKQQTGPDADRDSQPHTYPNKNKDELKTTGDIGYKGNDKNPSDLTQSNTHYAGQQDDDDFEKIVLLPKMFDLKLIKYITSINSEDTANRVLSVDTSKLNTVDSETKKIITTAEYILEKNPVSVKAGDFVTYTFRIYNEGDYDGYATEISEDIPEGLEFIAVGDGHIWSWDGIKLEEITEEIKSSEMYNKIIDINADWGYNQNNSIITTNGLSNELIKAFGKENVEYADSENKIDYKEISVIFRVKEDVQPKVTIRNEAAISEDKAVDGNDKEIEISDRDSSTEDWKKEDSDKKYDEEGKWPIYKEDDEDYDNIITKAFDLALRKQIVKINNGLYTQRFSKLDPENTYKNTLYDYYDVYSEIPKVKAGDVVTYSIRVYNEGDIDGYASLIVDTLPSGLEFVEYEEGDGSINAKYGWKLTEGTTSTYQTDYLSFEKDVNKGTAKSTLLKAYDGEGEASYQEIYIECKVKEDVTKKDSLLNVAQIANDSDADGKPIRDKDSLPGKTDDQNKWKDEDDLDIEILEIQEFDLALRKFITEIERGQNIQEVTTRIPEVSYNKEEGKILYTHPKDALVVHVGDTVIYTLRVYNEGEIDGYASEIKDDIPEYLEYLPEHEVNIKNEWIMYDEEGKETEDITKAVCIRTTYLAKGKGAELENKGANLIKAFDPSKEISEINPHYKEIKVAFKVKDPNSTEYEIVNFAQISEDTDSNGKPIKDKDSVPDNGEEDPKEDDEDIEKVKVEYFDLSLLKYVTKVLVNENGEQKVIETGNVGDENDIIPHVQIDKKNIDKTLVKFVYTIQITNEGQISGEATEITDYVPEGLVFVAEDNENWTDEGNNIISTKQLTGTILEPGESAQVEVALRWINGHNNLGPKTNIAEISEDYNKENIPDRDSTPDNKKEGEDDIDDATVILSINQGGGIQSIYIKLGLIFLCIIFIGTIIIKKFVL